MASIYIQGSYPLRGEVYTPGSKNAALPLLAASLLFEGKVTYTNVPDILDVHVLLQILTSLGASTDFHNHTVTIEIPKKLTTEIAPELARRLRASVLFMGPLLARIGQVFLPQPGGDLIGRRPIDTHLEGFQALGARITDTPNGTLVEAQNGLVGGELYLEEASVTATENLIMAALGASETTSLEHAAQEPHVQALCSFLTAAGVAIKGSGTNTLEISKARLPLKQTSPFAIPPDELDAGTFAIAALVTNGEITIHNYPSLALRPFTEKLQKIGAKITWKSQDIVTVNKEQELKAFTLKVAPAPGFPTDLQPPMTILATQANGVSLIHDWMYERRFSYVDELLKFGANITTCDPHRILVAGPTELEGRRIYSPDIRAGMAFVLAGLTAKGNAVIDHAEVVDRGYEQLVERLAAIGAHISRSTE